MRFSGGLVVLVQCSLLWPGLAQSISTPDGPPQTMQQLRQSLGLRATANSDAVCGFRARSVSVETGRVQRGLSVEMLVGDVAANRPTMLRFYVSQKPAGGPVED